MRLRENGEVKNMIVYSGNSFHCLHDEDCTYHCPIDTIFDCSNNQCRCIEKFHVVNVLVDGAQVEIQIVEELGYALGEDTCLFEEESETEEYQSEFGERHDDLEARRNIDVMVESLVEGLGTDDCVDLQVRGDVEMTDKKEVSQDAEKVVEEEVERDADTVNSARDCVESSNKRSSFPKVGIISGRDECTLSRRKRSDSCPPKVSRSIISGPWSLEWLHDHNYGDAEVIFSASKRLITRDHNGVRKQKGSQIDPRRRKERGLLSHPLHSIKKVARMPSKDRREVLKVLKKNVRHRRGGDGVNRSCSMSCRVSSEESSSSLSVNNDWQNWVAMQGTEQMAVDDVSQHAFSFRPLVGASGRLLTLWDTSEVEVWTTETCDHVLWCRGRFVKSGDEFLLANVYAPCDDGAMQGLWESLSARINMTGRERVCICGDFNAVRQPDERRSSRGSQRSADIVPFNHFIDANNLIDLPLIGRKFTWFKGDGLAMSRLDRFLLSEEWCLTWPNCKQVANLRGLSDDCPLVLSASEEDWGPRPSRMLKCWTDVPGYNLFVREKWNSLHVDGWGGIESLKERLSVLDQKGEEEELTEVEFSELHGVTADIHSMSRLHASISWQQSRSLWLKEGDANSKYFHSVLAGRRRRNAISVIQMGGVTLEGVNPIRRAVFSHFASHFKNPNVDRPGVDNLQFKRLNHLECSSLIKPFSETEVKSAVWDYFHRNGKLTKGINSTFIALIPKVDSPQRLNDFRPISLVGGIYKILAKVLANRLCLVIGSVISESQTAFVKDRQILDGILIANEIVDEARKSKKELMLFKVDFEKAYDSVDWSYLDKVMESMSFPTLWRKWIRECVGTATTSILVNGSPTDEFPLERGLRQGDLLSPFLFLLAAEGLNVLMEAMVARNLFEGYSLGEFDPISVTHLQFADDTLLMGAKSWANVWALRALLVLFETMSGLKVNFNKSMLVGVNIPESWLCEASSAFCCKVEKIPFIYLGLPIGGDSRHLGFWKPMMDRLKNRLSGWKSRFLSFSGRLVLIKSVLTSLPVYALSFFKAPSGIISSIESLLIKFFWGGCEDFRKTAWVNWKTICLRREYGGLGVRQLREFNLALLGKWCWRMLVDREGLWFRVLAARYGVEGGRLRDGGRRGSLWWREIVSIRDRWEEDMLRECQSLLSNISLQAQYSDRWRWQPDPNTGYTVRGAYQLLTTLDSVTLDDAEHLIWHPQVPLKVSHLCVASTSR
ncbi:unnamed protein product [Trifolium pratense]|uniref:Uncharacterized protein n=1 Tax=Trifolium pratense TaxID=57577 RepID=A0ACB0JEF3_TRIPR|nr:unnamed protein product [Trifolium pratense]